MCFCVNCLQGIDQEEKGSKESSKAFGANTPTVSCTFDRKNAKRLLLM